MRRSIVATIAGVAFVLVGGYFLAHDGFGFVLPQVMITLPSVDVGAVAREIGGSIALVRWNLVWPLALLLLGVLLLSGGWRTRDRSR